MSTASMIIGIGGIFFLMTCWALLDVAQKDFGTFEKKIAWGAVAWIPFIGFIIYLFFGYRRGKKIAK